MSSGGGNKKKKRKIGGAEKVRLKKSRALEKKLFPVKNSSVFKKRNT